MGNGRKRPRLATSPQSRSPSPSPLRRRLGGEVVLTEEQGRIGTEELRVDRKTEQAGRVERETTEKDKRRGGGGVVEEGRMDEVVRIMPSIWDSLSIVEKSWSAGPDELQRFAINKLKNPLLADMVHDAIQFELIHDTLQFWFCHLCGCYFGDGDSLTMHLKEHHFPSISKCQAWPLRYQRDWESAFVQEAVCKMVWKPIDVRRALQQFYTLCLDGELEAVMGSQGDIGWPLSDDDSERSELLVDLGRDLKALAFDKIGISFLSGGLLKRLIAAASWHILIRLPSRDHMLDFTRRLACSPLSFRFLDKESLFHFTRVAKRIRQLVRNEDLDSNSTTACIWNEACSNVSSCKMNEIDPPYFSIDFITPLYSHFFLKPAHGDYRSMRSWLFDKPSDIPYIGPLQPSLHPPSFLTHISVLSGACRQLTEIMGESISCFNESEVLSVVPRIAYYSIVSKWLHESLVEEESSDVGNRQFSDCFSKPALERMRNEYLTQTDSHSLRVVELFCVLESWEFKVRHLCTFNFCLFMLPLMQRFLQSCSILLSKDVCTEEFGYGDSRNSSSVAGYTSVSACEDVKKEHNPNMLVSMAASGTSDIDNSGLFFCVPESDLMRVIHNWDAKDLVRDAISHIRFHKTWRYWYCYMCRARFADSESHMNHMDNEHELGLPCDEQSGLAPRAPSKHEIDRLLGLEWMLIDSPLKTFLHKDGDHMESRAILTRMKGLLYSILDEKPVLFSASSHLIHLAEFARVEFFRDLRSDKKKLMVAREIDESSQLVFSMLDARCLRRVVNFLENLCKQCIPPQMQPQGSNEITHAAASGIFYADHTLQVDPLKFTVAFSLEKAAMNKEKLLPFVSKHEIMLKIHAQIEDELHSLWWHFNAKREVLRELDVVFALDRMLIGESDHVGTLMRRYEKLDSMDPAARSSFQHRLISQVLREASSCSIEEALEDEKDKLLSQLGDLDVQIIQGLAKIDELKKDISELCCCDYSTDVLPFVGVFLNPRIRLDAELGSWASIKLQELLFSIDHSDLSNEPANFRITSVSIGKVLVNITECKWGLGFDYRGMRLHFEGEWSFLLQGKRADGYIDFAGLSDWHACRNEHIQAKSEVFVLTGGMEHRTKELAPSLEGAVCLKLLKFQYEFVKQSTPNIPSSWHKGDVPLPFPNEPHDGEDPLKNMNPDCLKSVTSEFRGLSIEKRFQREREDDW